MCIAALGAHMEAGLRRERTHCGARVALARAILVPVAELTPTLCVRDAAGAPAATAAAPASPFSCAFGAAASAAPAAFALLTLLLLLLALWAVLPPFTLAALSPHAGLLLASFAAPFASPGPSTTPGSFEGWHAGYLGHALLAPV